jgi:hypothetical protein
MSRWLAGLTLVFGCYGTTASSPPAAPIASTIAAPPAAAVTIQASSVGPITARTPANLAALRALLVGYEVKPANVRIGEVQHLGYHVYKDGERLLYVIPDETGAITNVHAVSSKVAIADHPWKIGAAFSGVKALSTCKCWEEQVVVCFKTGEHVAVAFARQCSWQSFTSPEERQDLIGVPVQRILWSPRPYHEDSNPFGGSEYGGDEYGS